MAYDLEEQEQIETIKSWWAQYGKLVILAVTACVITVAAFQGWRYYRHQQALAAVTLPACISTNRLTSVRPIPRPPCDRASERSPCTNNSKMRGSCSGAIPIPVSRTRTTASSSSIRRILSAIGAPPFLDGRERGR